MFIQILPLFGRSRETHAEAVLEDPETVGEATLTWSRIF